jgi:plastocyanin
MNRRILAVWMLAATAGACGGYSSGNPATSPSPTPLPSSSTTVLIPSGAYTGSTQGFMPTPLTVAAGTTVTFGNNDGVVHTTTSDTGLWDSQSLNSGKTFERRFDTPGTYTYHCTIHPFMTGTIVVQ